MAVRNDFTAGEVLAAADLNDTFASKLPYSFGTATPSTTDSGFLWYDSNSTPAAPKFWDGAAFQTLGGTGKIVQIIRATDGSSRSTTSTSFVDVTGMTVTITPTKSDSAIIIIAAFSFLINCSPSGNNLGRVQITDSSNNIVSGGGEHRLQGNATANLWNATTIIGYATPATTSAVTYKLRFKVDSASVTAFIENGAATGQMYAIEVAA